MPYIPLYYAQLTQTGNTISAILYADARPNVITGSWTATATGSYNFISSGSFSGASGSITGSLGINLTYQRLNSSDTGSISVIQKDSNTMILQTSAYPIAQTLNDNVIKGTCSIDIGIYY
jgi:hypothetical protein